MLVGIVHWWPAPVSVGGLLRRIKYHFRRIYGGICLKWMKEKLEDVTIHVVTSWI